MFPKPRFLCTAFLKNLPCLPQMRKELNLMVTLKESFNVHPNVSHGAETNYWIFRNWLDNLNYLTNEANCPKYTERCDLRELLSPGHIHFEALLLAGNIYSGEDEPSFDLIDSKGKSVLSIEKLLQSLSNNFLNPWEKPYSPIVDGNWLACIQTLFSMYTRCISSPHFDQGFSTTSERWKHIT